MLHYKRVLLLGCTALLAVTLFTFSPMHASQAFAASINSCPPQLIEGASGDWVKVLQATLNGQEADSGGLFHFGGFLSVDGLFGRDTEIAVTDWQRTVSGTSGLGNDGSGLVGHDTWASLGYCVSSYISDHTQGLTGYSSCPPTLSTGSSGVWVKALQSMLNVDLWFGNMREIPLLFTPYLATDGSFGQQTQYAVIDFQHSNGTSQDGIVGPNTWGKLRMCW